MASKRAIINDLDEEESLLQTEKEFESLGKLAFSFDSGTTAAVKQMRQKLLMADIGAMNLEIDEIGNNLLSNADVLGTFLELFDVGKVKQKLTKNTKENTRSEEIEGKTPTNLLLFGTPAKLFNGSKTEEELWSFIQTGYGRRCFFGYTREAHRTEDLTAEQIYDTLTDKSSTKFLENISSKFGRLAEMVNFNKVITVSKDVSIQLIEYRMHCEAIAYKLGEHEDMRKAELSHRYFKALKLAGAYAFIDGDSEISEDNLYAAIRMAEESGKAFDKMLNQDNNYVKLAKYIAAIKREVTHVDLTENLPFYKGAANQKAEMMQLAIAWGYKNQVIIKQRVMNNIEFIQGETLEPTDLNKMTIAYSKDISDGYKNVQAPFNKLHKLTSLAHNHWINHHSLDGHRSESHMLPGCDMIVLDIDSGVSIKQVELLLIDYQYLIYTTKRHTNTHNRFRVILPLNYRLELDEDGFKEFMQNVYEWLPFECDTATGQRSRKWLTNNQSVYSYGSGKDLLDTMLFIPNTSKNDERKQVVQTLKSFTNVERWFITNTNTGNRNNQLVRYALMLVDLGTNINSVRNDVIALNDKLDNSLSPQEIESTIMVTVNKAIAKRGSA